MPFGWIQHPLHRIFSLWGMVVVFSLSRGAEAGCLLRLIGRTNPQKLQTLFVPGKDYALLQLDPKARPITTIELWASSDRASERLIRTIPWENYLGNKVSVYFPRSEDPSPQVLPHLESESGRVVEQWVLAREKQGELFNRAFQRLLQHTFLAPLIRVGFREVALWVIETPQGAYISRVFTSNDEVVDNRLILTERERVLAEIREREGLDIAISRMTYLHTHPLNGEPLGLSDKRFQDMQTGFPDVETWLMALSPVKEQGILFARRRPGKG